MQPQQLLATRVVMPPQRCFPRYFSGNISPGFRTSVVMLQGKGVTERTDLPRLQRRSVLFFFLFFLFFFFPCLSSMFPCAALDPLQKVR